MRNHRLFGVFIAVLLGTSLLLHRPNSLQGHHPQAAGPHIIGSGIQLASATLPAGHRDSSPPVGEEPPSHLRRPFAARYLEASWAWTAYV